MAFSHRVAIGWWVSVSAVSTLLLGVGALYFDSEAPVHGCVGANGTVLYEAAVPNLLEGIDTSDEDVTILLRPLPDEGLDEAATSMCVLHRWTASIENKTEGLGYYFPLGRSIPAVPGEQRPDSIYGAYRRPTHMLMRFDYFHSLAEVSLLDSNYTGQPGDWARPMGKGARQVEYRCGEAGNSGVNFAEGECKCCSSRMAFKSVLRTHTSYPFYSSQIYARLCCPK